MSLPQYGCVMFILVYIFLNILKEFFQMYGQVGRKLNHINRKDSQNYR